MVIKTTEYDYDNQITLLQIKTLQTELLKIRSFFNTSNLPKPAIIKNPLKTLNQ